MTTREDIPHRLLLGLILLFMAVVDAPDVAAQTQPANETRILLTAVDKNQRLVSTLRREDLRIIEDGTAREVVNFELLKDQSAAIAILIDASASQERTLPGLKLAATSFVDSIMRPAADKAAVATFTGTLEVQQNLTNDLKLLRQAIERAKFVPPSGYIGGVVVSGRPPISRTQQMIAGSTAIWDAVLAACEQLFSGTSGQMRSAIILLTDGEDTISKAKMSDAVARANRDNIVIYSIGIGDTYTFGIDKDALRKLSERTGGRSFFPKKVSELPPIFTEIGEELRTQYLMVYSSNSNAGAVRKIKVEIVNPALRGQGIQLSYQRLAPGK